MVIAFNAKHERFASRKIVECNRWLKEHDFIFTIHNGWWKSDAFAELKFNHETRKWGIFTWSKHFAGSAEA